LRGVKEAQDAITKYGGTVAPKFSKGTHFKARDKEYTVYDIEFEVALTSDGSSKKSGKIGVAFGLISLAGKGSQRDGQQSVTNIRFTVPIVYPEGQLP